MAGEMGSSISEMRVESYNKVDNEAHVFSKINFTVPKGCSEFKLRFRANDNCTGILLVPCKFFDPIGGSGKGTKAMMIFDSGGERTDWSATVPVNFVSISERDEEIIFKKDRNQDEQKETNFELAAIFVGIKPGRLKINCETSNSFQKTEIQNSNKKSCHIKARFDWIIEFIKRQSENQPTPSILQFHPKQQATIKAIEKLEFESSKIDLTYIGPDDTSNCLTALLKITSQLDNGKVKIRFRFDDDYDAATNRNFINNWLEKLDVSGGLAEHPDEFETTDLIIETYTLMNWPKEESEVKSYLGKRLEALNPGGSLILVFPEDIAKERFSTNDKLPGFFKESQLKLKKK